MHLCLLLGQVHATRPPYFIRIEQICQLRCSRQALDCVLVAHLHAAAESLHILRTYGLYLFPLCSNEN